MCLLGVSSYGTYLLKTDSNLAWFLPTDSYLTRFFNRYDTYFGDGMLSDLYIGESFCAEKLRLGGFSLLNTISVVLETFRLICLTNLFYTLQDMLYLIDKDKVFSKYIKFHCLILPTVCIW